jgi:hypothetical protein
MSQETDPLGIHVPLPMNQRPSVAEDGTPVMELEDPSQQIPLWAFNQMDRAVKLELFADGVPKQTVILPPKAYQQVLIMTCLPEFHNMAGNPMVAWFERTGCVRIKARFSLPEDPENSAEAQVIYKFVPVGQEVSWMTKFGNLTERQQ